MKQIIAKTFDEERALYHQVDTEIRACRFEGPADGESVIKEGRNVNISDCYFDLRYPIWHVHEFNIDHTEMSENSRAPLWYCHNGQIKETLIASVKAVRECSHLTFTRCRFTSTEFGWRSSHLTFKQCSLVGEYAFFESRHLFLEDFHFQGKYSFQYVENVTIRGAELDTKDAFWHAKNVTVSDSVVKGEYLGWYSENLKLIRCHIIGTQPLCYCKGLVLEDCTMEDCDLAFENSEVKANINGYVESIKNVRKGRVQVDRLGELIIEDSPYPVRGKVIVKEKEGEKR